MAHLFTTYHCTTSDCYNFNKNGWRPKIPQIRNEGNQKSYLLNSMKEMPWNVSPSETPIANLVNDLENTAQSIDFNLLFVKNFLFDLYFSFSLPHRRFWAPLKTPAWEAIFLLAPEEGLFLNRNIGKIFCFILFFYTFCFILLYTPYDISDIIRCKVQSTDVHLSKQVKRNGEGKRRYEFAEWHVAWLAEWHNYAEFNLWKMAQRKKIQQESMRASLPLLFWRQFERSIDLPVHLLLLLKQG